MAVPASRYAPSPRVFPEEPPPIEYGPCDLVRKVDCGGLLSFRGRSWRVGKAFQGCPVALRATTTDALFDVVFCRYTVAQIDLRSIDQGHR